MDIIDYNSGTPIQNAGPEEIEATQPFSKKLVEEFGYEKGVDIITRPQHFIPKNASSESKPGPGNGFPVDIAVFDTTETGNRYLKIIVECKKSSEDLNNHIKQLQDYMILGRCYLGVLYNGKETKYIHMVKPQDRDGFDFESIAVIPRKGELLSDIGKLKKKDDLDKNVHSLKTLFNDLRGWIVANGNITRDQDIASQMILLILCKIYDERYTDADKYLSFRASITESDTTVEKRIKDIYTAMQSMYSDVVTAEDVIIFDAKTLKEIVLRLQNICFTETARDVIADAFEIFISKSVKEGEGQFFTPRNIIQVMITAINPELYKFYIDSACGSGGFLVEILKQIERLVDELGNRKGWTPSAKHDEVKSQAIKYICGLEKDPFLTKLAKSYMAILGDGKGGIFREDSLDIPKNWGIKTQQLIKLEHFDYLLANPPFGKNIKVEGEDKLMQYELGTKTDTKNRKKALDSGNVSSLFLERNLQLLRSKTTNKEGCEIPGGKMAIILPEPYFALKKYNAAFDLMCRGNNIEWVIDLPQNTFRPHNNAKCCAIVLQKGAPQQEYINMAVLEYMGHDHQGKPIYIEDCSIKDDEHLKDDAPQVIKEIIERRNNNGELVNEYDRPLTFKVKAEEAISRKVLIPRFYWQEKQNDIERDADKNGFKLIKIQDLIDSKALTCFSGHGSPKAESKGMGDIPYIRVKDIVNWQAYVDVTSLITREDYNELYSEKKELKPKDILYVSRGSYRIGSVAMVSPYDGEMILTREIIVLRLKEDNEFGITPEYLLYALSHKYIWEQAKNKIFYEPCLPNIADRWKELKIPVPKDSQAFEKLKEQIHKTIYDKQWAFKKEIAELKENYGAYLI